MYVCKICHKKFQYKHLIVQHLLGHEGIMDEVFNFLKQYIEVVE